MSTGTPSPTRQLRIVFDTPAWFAYPTAGGATTKVAKLQEYLQAAGHEVGLFDKWSPREADIYHYFSSAPAGITDVALAKQRNLPVVIEPIYWVTLRYLLQLPSLSLGRRTRGALHLAMKRTVPGLLPQTRMLQLADLLIANSPAEAELLRRHFRVPRQRIHVGHNAADAAFLQSDESLFIERFGLRDFVLCVGNIEPRKNQARLARAARELGLPLVLIGNALPHQAAFVAQVRRELSDDSLLLEGIRHDDPLLRSAYAAASVFALPSFAETPGKAALEAALAGTPVVVTERGSAPDYFGDLAVYVDPHRVESIRRGIDVAISHSRERPDAARKHVATNFTWDVATRERVDAYRLVLHRRSVEQ